MGGEKALKDPEPPGLPGSPPRGRGKAATFGGSWKRWRITPAWAGKSRRSACSVGLVRDHPRVGGEKI